MASGKPVLSVLIVSSAGLDAGRVAEILGPSQYAPISLCSSAGEARRLLLASAPDLLIINAPLPDDSGIQLALDAAQGYGCGILLLVKAALFEQVCYTVEDSGILTLQKPASRQALYQAVKLLTAARARLKILESQTASLQKKMEEISIVNRAKWLLVEHLGMTEPEAHRYLEKQAMDTCQKRRTVAEKIIRTYES